MFPETQHQSQHYAALIYRGQLSRIFREGPHFVPLFIQSDHNIKKNNKITKFLEEICILGVNQYLSSNPYDV